MSEIDNPCGVEIGTDLREWRTKENRKSASFMPWRDPTRFEPAIVEQGHWVTCMAL